jgi:hypothetical protein
MHKLRPSLTAKVPTVCRQTWIHPAPIEVKKLCMHDSKFQSSKRPEFEVFEILVKF